MPPEGLAADAASLEAALAGAAIDASEARIDTAEAEANASLAEASAEAAANAAATAASLAQANAAMTIEIVARRIEEVWTKLQEMEAALATHSHPELLAEIADLRSQMTGLLSLIQPEEPEPEAEEVITEEVEEAIIPDAAEEDHPVAEPERRHRIRVLR